jgi:L-lysine 2,3-aminomutase
MMYEKQQKIAQKINPEVLISNWKDWKWQLNHCIRDIHTFKNTTMVRDVLLSGGDPLMLSDEDLDWILTELRKIPHVEVIRIGTRMPVVLPYRITDELVQMLKKLSRGDNERITGI